jgi:DNA repair protein RadD
MITLRPYQIEGLTAIWNYFQNGGKGNPVIAWPTGTGKSIIPATFIMEIMKIWPNQRFLIITHVKELIKQNYDLMMELWPNAPAGIYSAGLKQKDIAFPIIFGGIQSMIKNPAQFGHRDIIIIDEAHLVSSNESSQYLTFIATMKIINPYLKVIGMSATPFRMGMGYITENGVFTDIVHDITGLDKFNQLIDDGYICPLVPKRTKTELDVSNVGIQNNEFKANELQAAVDVDRITEAALKEIIHYGADRKSWLIFASGIEHAEHIADMLDTFGVEAAAIHSKKPMEFNDKSIEEFKNFEIQAIVNYGKLTTGFNHPAIDLIGMLRPTLSVPLWIQMLGRGTRPYPNKENCLVLDFARNTPRLGPINDPIIPRKKGEKGGDAPVKICENCGAYNHARVRFCCDCGNEFEFQTKIIKSAGTEELIKIDKPVFETFDVQYVIYSKKQSRKDGKPYIRVTYFTGIQAFNENVFPEHKGLPRHNFKNWWKQRHKTEPPDFTDDALRFNSELRCPRKIVVHVNKKYPEVLSCEW